MTLWAGRVDSELAPEVWELVKAADAELFPYDVEGTRLHARRLAVAGILEPEELAQVEARLSALDASMIEETDEDVHSAIERLLGQVGRKIHAGRSRNDQVVTAFRLWTLNACAEATAGIEAFAGVLLDRAEEHAETLMPGYTHLQRAQPVTLGHHLLAWVEMLDRDRDRFALAASHAEPSPLGAGALAGTTLPLPKVRNSLDAVADRDFALDYLYACAALFVHLSRIGEELALWASAEFGFVRLPESAATGSSMMPQKLNPDVAELARGKAGTAIGRLTGLLATVKGLPLAYNSDLGEDKPASFAARRDVRLVLAALVVLVRDLVFCEERLRGEASDPGLLATDAAEALVAEGVPFRDAHADVARAVRDGAFDPQATAAESVASRLGRRAGRGRCRQAPLLLARNGLPGAGASWHDDGRRCRRHVCPQQHLRTVVQDEHTAPTASFDQIEHTGAGERAFESRLRRHLDASGDGRRRLRWIAVVDAAQPQVDVTDRNAALRHAADDVAAVQRLGVLLVPADVDLDVRVDDRREVDAQDHAVPLGQTRTDIFPPHFVAAWPCEPNATGAAIATAAATATAPAMRFTI